jgi:hypothetical protein
LTDKRWSFTMFVNVVMSGEPPPDISMFSLLFLRFHSVQRWASQRFFDSSQVKSFSKNFKSSQVKSSVIQEMSKSSQVKSKLKPALIKFYFIREGSRYDTFILFQRKMIFHPHPHIEILFYFVKLFTNLIIVKQRNQHIFIKETVGKRDSQ